MAIDLKYGIEVAMGARLFTKLATTEGERSGGSPGRRGTLRRTRSPDGQQRSIS
jgi:hypothetical protein